MALDWLNWQQNGLKRDAAAWQDVENRLVAAQADADQAQTEVDALETLVADTRTGQILSVYQTVEIGNIDPVGTSFTQILIATVPITPPETCLVRFDWGTRLTLKNASGFRIEGIVTATLSIDGAAAGVVRSRELKGLFVNTGPNPTSVDYVEGTYSTTLTGSTTYQIGIMAKASMTNGTAAAGGTGESKSVNTLGYTMMRPP